jgi:hypothetical protein
MIEVALFTGIGLLGYILATQNKDDHPREPFVTSAAPPNVVDAAPTDRANVSQSSTGHNNMVPFFGAKITQNLRADTNNSILDTFAGTGTDYFQKREVETFYDVKPGFGLPFGNANESDFMQSRMVGGMNMKNVFPIEQTRVAPGLNDGYNNLGKGGYQQFNELQEFAKPRTTDEIRAANKPKVTYDMPVVPGSHYITQPGLQAPVQKNRPDTFHVLTGENGELIYVNTTTGAQVAPAAFPEQMQKEQQRSSTNIEYYGSGGASYSFGNYVRAFTEPFEQFMKLTVGEWFGTGGGSGAAGEGSYVVDQYLAAYTNPGREASVETNYTAPGYISVNSGEATTGAVKVNKDENMLVNVRQFVDPANVVSSGASVQQIGQFRYTEHLPQDSESRRIDPSILDAFHNNPYTHSLQSVA